MVGMRVKGGVRVRAGTTLTPPLPPLAFALSLPSLSSHCSACFSLLPSSSSSSSSCLRCRGSVWYCSASCREVDLPLHIHSGECHLLALAADHVIPEKSRADLDPAFEPMFELTLEPAFDLTLKSAVKPTFELTFEPTLKHPTSEPTINPTFEPVFKPTFDPTFNPTLKPTLKSTFEPTFEPILKQTFDPTLEPILEPKFKSTFKPTLEPTFDPTFKLTFKPTFEPAFEPTFKLTSENAAQEEDTTFKLLKDPSYASTSAVRSEKEHLQVSDGFRFSGLFLAEDSVKLWRGPVDFSALGGTRDLRVALRFLLYHRKRQDIAKFLTDSESSHRGEIGGFRLGGLISNRSKLLASKEDSDPYNDLTVQIRTAALFMSFVIQLAETERRSISASEDLPLSPQCNVTILAEEVLCQVIMNGVQVLIEKREETQTMDAHTAVNTVCLGTAIYGPLFSWLNHSCRPNACYSFSLQDPQSSQYSLLESLEPLITPDLDRKSLLAEWGLGQGDYEPSLLQNMSDNQESSGPCILVRSITSIGENEAVCISYTDLLQTKETRKFDLWSKYLFSCECTRCQELTIGSADELLRSDTCECFGGSYGQAQDPNALKEMLHSEVEKGILMFLKDNDPLGCCCTLDNFLLFVHALNIEGHFSKLDQDDYSHKRFRVSESGLEVFGHGFQSPSCNCHGKDNTGKSDLVNRLHLDVYTALASAYRVLASNGISSQPRSVFSQCKEAKSGKSDFLRASAAYKFLFAAATQILFQTGEFGLIEAVARSWLDAGEALLRCVTQEYSLPFSKHQQTSKPGLETLNKGDHSGLSNASLTLSANGSAMGASNDQQPFSSDTTLAFWKSLPALMHHAWPILRSASSPFLQLIANPVNLVSKNWRERSVLKFSRSDNFHDYICIHLLKSALSCFSYSKYLLLIVHSFKHPIVDIVIELIDLTSQLLDDAKKQLLLSMMPLKC